MLVVCPVGGSLSGVLLVLWWFAEPCSPSLALLFVGLPPLLLLLVCRGRRRSVAVGRAWWGSLHSTAVVVAWHPHLGLVGSCRCCCWPLQGHGEGVSRASHGICRAVCCLLPVHHLCFLVVVVRCWLLYPGGGLRDVQYPPAWAALLLGGLVIPPFCRAACRHNSWPCPAHVWLPCPSFRLAVAVPTRAVPKVARGSGWVCRGLVSPLLLCHGHRPLLVQFLLLLRLLQLQVPVAQPSASWVTVCACRVLWWNSARIRHTLSLPLSHSPSLPFSLQDMGKAAVQRPLSCVHTHP